MSSTAHKRTDWKRIFAELVSACDPLDVEELSAALIARGQHALMGGDMLKEDEKVLQESTKRLLEAALCPGPIRLRARLAEAEKALVENFHQADVTERAIAAVLNIRDQWLVKARGLWATGLSELARDVERHVSDFDAFLFTRHAALEAVSGFKDDALADTLLGMQSVWNRVPDAIEVEPALAESGAYLEQLSDEDLTWVAMGTADEVLERRVSLAIRTEPQIRERYDSILADLDAIEAPAIVPLSVKSLLSKGIHAACPMPQRLAASDKLQARYEEPADEDEIFVFDDESQLFAQKRPGGWVLFLYRQSPHEDDAITGSGVEATWFEGRLLCAELTPGEIQVRCHGQTQVFRLDMPPE